MRHKKGGNGAVDDGLTHRFRAEDGLRVCVRPLRPDDADRLVDLFEHLSPESRYRRFNIPLPDPDPEFVRREAQAIADLAPARGHGWLAFADLPEQPGACVAGIRYLRTGGEVAEVSLVVRDDVQGLGIGSELLRIAGRHAYQAGVHKLVGYVQSDNRPLWRSLRHLGAPLERELQGPETYVEVDLEEVARRGLLDGAQSPEEA